ncbi:uncharacterized protein MAM_07823 [Metarhizium album ARSEF 1941]|uniref:Flo11 n=1 Tax=Metarhizium album (strain ARSEF 1941) TaxID=1081103 RepID=A0A0B2WKW5_METAS|nr:uncharacterized protein MAM_07823 [Metarhizium album ARSEF 1941]KHN94294.1 hypothetical protein MAM_07823 [Metarhizium album ARSEF 1941]
MVSLTVDANASRPPSGVVSPRHVRSRAQSISSDKPSTIGYGLVSPPVSVSPQAAFIASSAASQIITNDHDSHADAWYDQNGIDPATETATVSAPALQLVNGFLDQLLFHFLQVSKSTALSALRPAVIEVLKPKLGKDAVSNADEELREYLGGANEEEYEQLQEAISPRNWDGELAWKRTRLRCMVYSSLGDMEEEDEDVYMEEENLEIGAHEQISDTISPAVAIFLTSIIEYMGELTLTVAGQAAYQRIRSKIEKELKDGVRNTSDPADRIVVTEFDMERVALDRTLGRLWRGWKKRMRTPTTDIPGSPKGPTAPFKPEQTASGHDILSLPESAASDDGSERRNSRERFEGPIMADVQPADIPLPVGDNDIDEIEVPGLAHHSGEEDDDEMDNEPVLIRKRPRSLLSSSSMFANGLPTPTKSQPHTPVVAARQRSMSLPTPRIPHFFPKFQGQTPAASAAESEADKDASAEIGIAVTTRDDGSSLSPAHAQSTTTSGAPAPKDVDAHSQSSVSEYDDAEEVAYEQAEIMTTARVSMSSSAHSVDFDSHGRASSVKRSSSVHSARIIDVPALRSPARSRPSSMDATERPRPVSLSGVASGLSKTTILDDGLKAANNETLTKTANGVPLQRSSHERRKPAAGNPTAISELEEEASQNFAQGESQLASLPVAAEMPAAGHTSSPWSQRKKKLPVAPNIQIQSSKYEHSPVHAGTAPLPATPATPDIETRNVQDLPNKATGHSGWSSPKPETRGPLAIERTRTRESDELSLPTQQQNNFGSRQGSQAHTAASSVSSGASRLKPVRTSEDGSSRSESVARNFEELIQSNQTITYTLTPENMRDIDAKRSLDSPVVTKFARRKSEDSRAYQYSPKVSPVLTQSAAGNLPSPRLPPSPASPKIMDSKAIKPAGPATRVPTTSTTSTVRASGATAREARVPPDSTSDFAEFIKSTGPADGTRSYTVPKLGPPPASSNKGHQEAHRRASATGSVGRSRYQPRDATVDSRTDNSDLIDFIRQGPPIAASNHRIPRHVAPFRTTMDSDQMSGAIGGKAIDANIPDIRSSRASTNATESSMPSMQSSVNSRSALVKNRASNIPNQFFDDDENMMPKRKTRRVRDPYAIDLSDGEDETDQDDHMLDTPRLPAKKEESLAEFLRNYEPPPEPVSAAAARTPRKKASAPSLIGRLTRGGKDKEKDSASTTAASEARAVVSRASSGRGYIPIQVNIPPGYDQYDPMNGNVGATQARGTLTASATAGRAPMKKFEPREAASKRSETADLAAFLRDSAPPMNNSPTAINGAPSQQEDSGGFTRMFGRRKKPLAL